MSEIDDKPVEHSLLSKNQTIILIPGEHSIVLKYKDVFEDFEFGAERLIKSDNFVVKFKVNTQESVFLSTTNIRDLAEAERFASAPELKMLDENNQSLVLSLEKLSDYKLEQKVAKVVSILSVSTASSKHAVKDELPANNDQNFNDKVIDNVDVTPMLQYWWNKANKEEKETFIKFINKIEQ